MNEHELYIRQCLKLAEGGLGHVAPNPLVGAVLVHQGQLIGKGFHEEFGKPHAEVNCIVDALSHAKDEILADSTLYVNLEPCSHHGKTPPCADLIIKHRIGHVVISNTDPYAEVNGSGIKRLTEAGIKVTQHVLENEGRELNRRFFTFHEKKRPYIILKWAQTLNGFIAPLDKNYPKRERISNDLSHQLVHKWRSEEQGIMVGTNTACIDNPHLNVREWKGKNPLRILLDKDLRIPSDSHLLNGQIPTVVFTSKISAEYDKLRYVSIDFGKSVLPQIFDILHRMQIQSVMVEGGRMLLQSFIAENYWDEARVFTSAKMFPVGVSAPHLTGQAVSREDVGDDSFAVYRNNKNLHL
jgi:diaminohydroxyphosphoribosylaminopyrimidine deaminase/5-amino-6-(5-phosphoribosylamino)uracil reductase